MHILILGYSSIAHRRVIPALSELDQVKKIDVACKRSDCDIDNIKLANIYNDYAEALEKSSANIVYISLVNSLHYQWAEAALKSHYHVIVDKPAFLSSDEAKRMVALANQVNRALIEATVFSYHPQIKRIQTLLAESEPLRLTTSFSFPPMADNNFRYEKLLGGGALLDLGPYAITAANIIFNVEPQRIAAHINMTRAGVETSFSVLMSFGEGRSMVGHFGFDTQYENGMSILTDNSSIEIDRVFTLPGNQDNIIRLRSGSEQSEINVPASDMFANFFESVFSSIQTENFSAYSAELVRNAAMQERLTKSAWSHHG